VTSPPREPGSTISHRSVAPSSALLGTLAECTLPHEVVEPLEALALAELDALATSSTVLLTRSLPILSEFYLDVAADLVRALDDALLAALRALAASLDHVLDALTATWNDVHEVAAGVTVRSEPATSRRPSGLNATVVSFGS
jgi:hypothetical protein